jgi:hypothetical protein
MRSVLMCPHGGMVSMVPAISTAYRIDGYRPLLLSDVFIVAGCPFAIGTSPMPCQTVNWVMASNFLTVKGIPVLTSSSVGLTAGGGPSPVIMASIQSSMEEPSEITNIDY